MTANFLQPVFKNNLHNSYIILKAKESSQEQYQLKMVENNDIKGLLKLSTERFDGSLSCYYDITDMQSVTSYIQRWGLNYDFLFQLLKSVSIVTSEVRSYLVDASRLIIETDYIFYDELKERFGYCFHPDYQRKVKDNLFRLSEELSDTGAEDEKGRLLIKEIRERVKEDYFSIDRILDLAAGKHYETHHVRSDLKENLEHIRSQIHEEEVNPTKETDVVKEKRRLPSLKYWFTYINDKLSRR